MATTDAVRIVEWDAERGEDENVVAVIELRNDGEQAETRTVRAKVRAGGKVEEPTKGVEVVPGVPKEVRLHTALPHKKFRKNGELTTDLR